MTQLLPDSALREAEGMSSDDNEDATVNAWFGPKGTISPLHYDPKNNLLCQVVGSKYVRLYSPAQSAAMYPAESGMCTNSSQVDAETPDAERFPLFQKVLSPLLHALGPRLDSTSYASFPCLHAFMHGAS